MLCRNTKLQGAITDMLQRQFKAFYEADEDVQPPLKLQPCITAQGTNVFLAEPLVSREEREERKNGQGMIEDATVPVQDQVKG